MAEFSLLSLNTFGIPFNLAKGRLRRLARELNRSTEAVICLQELQQNAYAVLMQRGLDEYPDRAIHLNRFAPKGGLAVFSRLPVVDHNFIPYEASGSWLSIGFADRALFKGILMVQFDLDGIPVTVLNTHMHANYTASWRSSNSLARTQLEQAAQLAQLVQSLPEDALVVVCGDLNFPRASHPYEALAAASGLVDPLADDPRPTYRPFPLVPSSWKISLDYVLYRLPRGKDFRVQADIIPVEDSIRPLPFTRFLTDHNALTLKVSWDSGAPAQQ